MQSEFQEGEGLKDEKKKTMKRQVGPLTWLAIMIIFKELGGKVFCREVCLIQTWYGSRHFLLTNIVLFLS